MSSSSTGVTIPADSNAKQDTGKVTAPAGTGAAAVAPAGPAGSKKRAIHRGEWKRGVYVFDFALRLAAIAAALAATIAMGTADETLPFFTQFRFHASYDDLPALTFFVISNAIVSGYFVLSLPFSFVTIIRPRAMGLRLLLLVFDTVMVGLSSAGAASATTIVYLAHTGSSKANWLAICQQFKDLCQRMGGAVVASFLAALIVMLLVVMSALALRKP